MQNLKIEMIHDVVCSWCHIGYRHLSHALDILQHEFRAEIHYLPFQLNPDLAQDGVEIVTHLRQRHGWSRTEAADYRAKLLTTAQQSGVLIDFNKRTHYYNTDAAHRLILLAQQTDRQRDVHRRLLHAYHVEGKNIADIQVLLELAETIGLEKKFVLNALYSETINQQMHKHAERVASFAVQSVPAFVFNNDRLLSGSNSSDFFVQWIRQNFSNTTTHHREIA